MPYVYFAVILLCAVGAYRLSRRRRFTAGLLKLKNGHRYAYVFGDNLAAEAVRFHGLQVQLPAKLPDFYLDAAGDSKLYGPNMLFSNHQRMQLEGDFNKYFQLFVPRGNQVDVLSILSPDVMQTLIGTKALFDVYLHQDQLRIISPRSVYGMDAYEIDMLKAASAIMAELDQRLVSWQPSAASPALVYKRGKTLKLANRYVRRGQLLMGLLLILLSVVIAGLTLALYYTHLDPHFSDPYSKGLFAGLLMNAAKWIVLIAIPFVPVIALIWFQTHKSRAVEYLYALIGR